MSSNISSLMTIRWLWTLDFLSYFLLSFICYLFTHLIFASETEQSCTYFMFLLSVIIFTFIYESHHYALNYDKKLDVSNISYLIILYLYFYCFQLFNVSNNTLSPRFNPVVTSVSIILITGFITWCILEEDAKTIFSQARLTVTRQFSWFYTSALVSFNLLIVVDTRHVQYV